MLLKNSTFFLFSKMKKRGCRFVKSCQERVLSPIHFRRWIFIHIVLCRLILNNELIRNSLKLSYLLPTQRPGNYTACHKKETCYHLISGKIHSFCWNIQVKFKIDIMFNMNNMIHATRSRYKLTSEGIFILLYTWLCQSTVTPSLADYRWINHDYCHFQYKIANLINDVSEEII